MKNFIKDIGYALQLLRREGAKSFIYRTYWYVKGYRLPEDIEAKISMPPVVSVKAGTSFSFPESEEPLVSVIIPVHNKWEYTHACLYSILIHSQEGIYEVILADDNSSDETRNADQLIGNITVARNEEALGFLKNVNRAATRARGKYLYLLNNDTQVTAGWLEPVLALFDNDTKAGLVGSKLIYPSGRLQEAGGIIFRDASGWNYGRNDNPSLPEYNYIKEVDYCSGAGICVRKDLWDRLGGFDERFAPAYYEDTDLAFSIRSLGYKVLYQPRSVIIHFEGVTHGRDIHAGIKSKQAENRIVFLEKWKEVLQNQHSSGPEELFEARDRSRQKITLLVVDHFVPKFDRDAGSRSTFQYLKLFVQMGLNVKFLTDNFHKDGIYAETLEEMGIEVLYGARHRRGIFEWLKNNGKYIDFIYLSRPHISIKYVGFIRENLPSRIIYQPHDLHFLRTLREYEITRDERTRAAGEDWKKLEERIFRSADVNLTFSSVEKKVIEDNFGLENVVVVPLYLYTKVPQGPFDPGSRRDILFVGGFSHPPNTDAVLWFVRDVFPEISKAIPGVKFHVVGSNAPEEVMELQSENILMHGYVSDEELSGLYHGVRLVVLPLRYGAGVKGKLIEAMYYGSPVVGTDIALEGIPGIEKVLVGRNTAGEFAGEVISLYSDEERCRHMSSEVRSFIMENFSEEKARELFEEIFHRTGKISGEKE